MSKKAISKRIVAVSDDDFDDIELLNYDDIELSNYDDIELSNCDDSKNDTDSKHKIVKKVNTKKIIKSDKTDDREETSEPNCQICMENYNHSTRKLLKCQYCHGDVCTKCVRTFLLSRHQEPYCMLCKTAWSRDFWMDSFPKTFVNIELKKHRQNILLDREKSLLPTSMPIAEKVREGNRLKEDVKKLDAIVRKAEDDMWNFNATTGDILDDNVYKKKKELSMILADVNFERNYQLQKINILLTRSIYKKNTEQPRQFVRACPADNCKGMLSTQWKCGLCGIFVCHVCHEIIGMTKDEPHTCKQENIETAKLLAKDTKPCPKCASLIFRISGCNQIFCTNCNHAFDWVSGQSIDYTTLHNPHFFEWRQHHGDAPINTNAPCGGMPTQFTLQNKCRSFGIRREEEVKICQYLLSSLMHNHDIEMPRYNPVDLVTYNEELRVKFLLNEITEETFKRQIFYKDKIEAKKIDIHRVMELFDTVTQDLIQRINNSTNKQQLLQIFNELPELITYVTSQMEIIEKRYNHKTPRLDDRYRWSRGRNL
jgi:hypothetical protein